MNKVLVVAVHPDDETLGCGGTILKHISTGDKVYWMVITAPYLGYTNSVDEKYIEEDDERINRVAKEYGIDEAIKLKLPTTELHAVDLKAFIGSVSKAIKRIQPEIIYMMFNNDVHSDHRVAFDAVYSCTKSFRYPFIKRILMIETLSETEFALPTQATSFVPNVYVDISDFIDRKLEIMSIYEKEVMQEPYPRSLSSIKALARVRGSRAGVMYAEAFQLLYEKR